MDAIVECQLPQIVHWASGAMALAVLAIGFAVQNIHSIGKQAIAAQRTTHDALETLHTMHQHPDDYGFGTKATNIHLTNLLVSIQESTEESRRVGDSLHDLIHYIMFDIKSRTGKAPPPPPPNGR